MSGSTVVKLQPFLDQKRQGSEQASKQLLLDKIRDRFARNGLAQCQLLHIGGCIGFVDRQTPQSVLNIQGIEPLSPQEVATLENLVKGGFLLKEITNFLVRYQLLDHQMV